MIPKIMHFVWVGNPKKEPKHLIQSWQDHHPDFEIRVYRNEHINLYDKNIKEFWDRDEYCGVADIVRWKMLYEHGGIAIDADSLCLRRLPNWILNLDFAAPWTSACQEGKRLSNGFVLANKHSPVVDDIINHINKNIVFKRWKWGKMRYVNVPAWETTGPTPLTEVAIKSRKHWITALPSHFFLPVSKDGRKYCGDGPTYAYQFWGSTKNTTRFNVDDARDYYPVCQ